jgi:hypothetical protein
MVNASFDAVLADAFAETWSAKFLAQTSVSPFAILWIRSVTTFDSASEVDCDDFTGAIACVKKILFPCW